MIRYGLIAFAVLIILGIIGVVGLNSQSQTKKGVTSPSTTTTPTPSATQDKDVALTLTYTGKGFEPNLNTIKVHSTVRIRNRSVRLLRFVSDPYPTQTDEPELNVGELQPGEGKTFFVSQKGTWGYHNALDPSERGTLIAE